MMVRSRGVLAELVAGFYLVDARDLNEALQIAGGIPPAKHGSIEVRPVRQLDVAGAIEPKPAFYFLLQFDCKNPGSVNHAMIGVCKSNQRQLKRVSCLIPN